MSHIIETTEVYPIMRRDFIVNTLGELNRLVDKHGNDPRVNLRVLPPADSSDSSLRYKVDVSYDAMVKIMAELWLPLPQPIPVPMPDPNPIPTPTPTPTPIPIPNPTPTTHIRRAIIRTEAGFDTGIGVASYEQPSTVYLSVYKEGILQARVELLAQVNNPVIKMITANLGLRGDFAIFESQSPFFCQVIWVSPANSDFQYVDAQAQ